MKTILLVRIAIGTFLIGGSRICADPLNNWHQRAPTPTTTQAFYAAAHGQSNFVAVDAAATIYRSPEGITWTVGNSGTTDSVVDVTYGSGGFVAAGLVVVTSPDGVTWSNRGPLATTGSYRFANGVAYGGGRCVAVGGDSDVYVIFHSTNFVDWTRIGPQFPGGLLDVVFGNGLFVAVEYNGTILTSPNGVTWTSRASGTTQHLHGIAYGIGRFVAVGANGTSVVSSNGINWTSYALGSPTTLTDVAFGLGVFAASANDGTVFTSPDGIGWTSRNTGTSQILNGVAYGAGTFVVVGENGLILQSDSMLIAPQITAHPQDQTIDCQTSTDISVVATGTAPLNYQWRKNGTPIAGATSSSLTIPNVQCGNDGSYSVVVSNAAGSVASDSALLTLVDASPPTVNCPADIVQSTAAGQCSAMVAYTVTASDDCGVTNLLVSPPSGSTFPKGTNLVICSATDCFGNTNQCSFTVTVLDTEPPVISCPAGMRVPCTSSNGAVVSFTVTATDNCDTNVAFEVLPPSGSTFPPGTNTVTCTAVDSSGNANQCMFTITVEDQGPPALSISLEGSQAEISWPFTCTAYLLEESDSIKPPAWTNTIVVPELIGNRYRLLVPTDTERYFRLRK